MKNRAIIFLKYYLPAILWAGVIFYFSSVPDLQLGTGIVSVEIVVRKMAHIVEYAVLYWLTFRIFFYVHKISFKASIVFPFIIAVLYAMSDEYHQTFTPGRSGRVMDVVFDSISAFLGLQILVILVRRRINVWKITLIIATVLLLAAMEFGMVLQGEEVEKNRRADNSNTSQGAPTPEVVPDKIIQSTEMEKNAADKKNNTPSKVAIPNTIPQKIKIDVPFTSQAPLGIWDQYHEEACEEAALIMMKYYLDHKKLTPAIAEKEIQAMIAYEIKKYGDYKDANVQQNVQLFDDFYSSPTNGKKLKVVYDFGPDDIKKYLAQGEPVIVPTAGRELGNPNFTPPGPLYHNLVLVGYDGDTIITNDSGTRKGEGFTYNINRLYRAIHDFPGRPEDIDQGRKAMIVLE